MLLLIRAASSPVVILFMTFFISILQILKPLLSCTVAIHALPVLLRRLQSPLALVSDFQDLKPGGLHGLPDGLLLRVDDTRSNVDAALFHLMSDHRRKGDQHIRKDIGHHNIIAFITDLRLHFLIRDDIADHHAEGFLRDAVGLSVLGHRLHRTGIQVRTHGVFRPVHQCQDRQNTTARAHVKKLTHAPTGNAEVRRSGCWSLWKNIAAQDASFGHPEKFCSDIDKTNWESATVTTSNQQIIDQIQKICKRDPRTGNVVTGGIVSCMDSKWLLSWTINRQGQFKEQKKDEVCIWVYSLFTDVEGDYVKKPMKECTGEEITQEWLYHLGIPVEDIPALAKEEVVTVPTMMPYITAFFMPRRKGDRPDVIPDGCVNFAFLGQFAETPRDTIFTTEYSVRTAMEAVYGLLKVDRGVPEVWGSVYDIRELLDSTVKLMDGKSPLDIELPGPLNALQIPLLRAVKGTVIEKLLEEHQIIQKKRS